MINTIEELYKIVGSNSIGFTSIIDNPMRESLCYTIRYSTNEGKVGSWNSVRITKELYDYLTTILDITRDTFSDDFYYYNFESSQLGNIISQNRKNKLNKI